MCDFVHEGLLTIMKCECIITCTDMKHGTMYYVTVFFIYFNFKEMAI